MHAAVGGATATAAAPATKARRGSGCKARPWHTVCANTTATHVAAASRRSGISHRLHTR